MASQQFDPFGYRALAAAITSLGTQLTALRAEIDHPAWLNPSPTVRETVGVAYPPIIDVGGQIYAKLDAIIANTTTIISDEDKDMAALDDLNAAVTALTNEVQVVVTNMNTLMTDLQAALAAANPTAIEAAVTGINNQVAALQAAVSADTPPP